MLQLNDVHKVYTMGTNEIRALDGVSFEVERGEMLAIMGPSGSGKSTLLNILGCLDVPTDGAYHLDGENVSGLTEDQLADIRNRRIGFVFQQFNLLPRTTALENVMIPLDYAGIWGKQARRRAADVLERVGLGERLDHHPQQLSGGQQQRVAIARALVNEPAIILADEPTGNLDTKTEAEIITLFQELHRDMGQTIIYVTHDQLIAQHTQRIIKIVDGNLVEDEPVANPLDATQSDTLNRV
jgi:putative ABC transport system ATP-binding protein